MTLRRPNTPCIGAILGALLALGIGLATSGAAQAARIYVDKDARGGACNDGRDRATALNPATPVCSIERGMTLAQTGDTVMVRGAIFVRSSPLGIGKSNFTLMAYPGERVILDFSGALTGNGINFGGNGVTLEGFEITNAPEEGISTWFTSDHVIRRNHVHHCGLVLVNNKYQNGIAAYGSNILIEQNLVHDTGSHNLYVYGDRITVRNNVIYKTIAPAGRGSYGIQVGTTGANCTNITIAHNVIAESINRSSIVLYAPQATISNITIVNNVLMTNEYSPVYVYNESGVATTYSAIVIRNNIFSENGRGDCVFFTATNGCTTPPSAFTVNGNLTFTSAASIGFRNLAAHDYYPAAGSAMLNAGLPGYATTDYAGTPRPQGSAPDIGPFEATVGGGPDVVRPAPIADLF
jgi:hypothetical protein